MPLKLCQVIRYVNVIVCIFFFVVSVFSGGTAPARRPLCAAPTFCRRPWSLAGSVCCPAGILHQAAVVSGRRHHFHPRQDCGVGLKPRAGLNGRVPGQIQAMAADHRACGQAQIHPARLGCTPVWRNLLDAPPSGRGSSTMAVNTDQRVCFLEALRCIQSSTCSPSYTISR